jgi:hypothetical protein
MIFGKPHIETDGKTVTASKLCTIKGEVYQVEVSEYAYFLWKNGQLIQNVMPNLSAEQREFLISGMTPAEFEDLFAEAE